MTRLYDSNAFLLLWFLCLLTWTPLQSENLNDRIRGQDEPQLVSFRVLEGVTEPFQSSNPGDGLPAWKLMKLSADEKASKNGIQQALQEYGQLLKHPYMFGEMPMDERYDVFLSMAKLLKTMGFHQKAELLLYEAMSYSQNPYDAHLQLGLIFLDKEDLDKAKMHMKNCLYYREADILILIHMAVILIAEGRIHEAKFYVTRILNALELRVQKFSFLYPNNEDKVAEALLSGKKRNYSTLTNWLEDLLVSVFHGEFTLPSVAVVDSLWMFSHLYEWLNEGEMSGRYVFDLGQSLYEGGRPEIGALMMHRGAATTDRIVEGQVSTEIVMMRASLDYPVIPDTLVEVIDSYLNMSLFLSSEPEGGTVDIDNSLDIYWPVPYIYFSALPLVPVIDGLKQRFVGGPERSHQRKTFWLKNRITNSTQLDMFQDNRVEIGVFGGHMNNHPVGQMVLYRLLNDLDKRLCRITLIATPLRPDEVTKHIASVVHNIVNLPLNTKQAWAAIDQLSIDVMLFPDWQPFPDQQSLLFQSRRIAPVQICFFVRGSSCSSKTIDYYLLPDDVSDYYTAASNLFQEYHSPYTEQVVILNWPVFTRDAIRTLAQHAQQQSSSESTATDDDLGFTSNEVEGRIFFDGQPVAVLAAHPFFYHPLMDEVLFRIMHSCPSLQIVIAVSSSFFNHAAVPRHRLNWARKLVRRLWARGGTAMAGRIRLLPLPIDDKRMLQLLRTADLVLDPFPIGSTLHANALALSVGTPVVTLNNGLHISTSKSDLSELRMHLHHRGRRFEGTWLYQTMMRSNHSNIGNIPWSPSLSPLGGFYFRIGMQSELVANDTNDYFNIASRLAKDREYAYHIRVKLLDAIDGKVVADFHNVVARQLALEKAAKEESGQGVDDDDNDDDDDDDEPFQFRAKHSTSGKQRKNNSSTNEEDHTTDIGVFLERIGRQWANTRLISH